MNSNVFDIIQSNNSASPEVEDQPGGVAVGGVLGMRVTEAPRMVTMTDDQLEKLINRSLDNYAKSQCSQEWERTRLPGRVRDSARGKNLSEVTIELECRPRAMQVTNSVSDNTVYEHFCDLSEMPQVRRDVDTVQRMQQLQADVSSALPPGGLPWANLIPPGPMSHQWVNLILVMK